MKENTGGKNSSSFFGKIFAQVPEEYAAEFQVQCLATNLLRMRVFTVYVVVLQIVLNVINALKPRETQPEGVMIYIALSLATLLLGGLYWALFRMAEKGKIESPGVHRFLIESFLHIYMVLQLTFCTLDIVLNGGVFCYVLLILIIGMVPISSPRQSILTIMLSFLYVVATAFFTRSVSGTWHALITTDLWTNLILVTAMTICVSVFIYDMYVSNFLQNVDLESTVSQRTRELEEQTSAAQVASKAKGEFLARMSHEIRTPLNAIIGMTQVAQKSGEPEKITASLGEIATASHHLLGILNDILDMSKIESGKFELVYEPFTLRTAMEEVAHIIALRCQEREIRLEANYAELPDLSLVGDRLRLKQVLINLLGNAVKFTSDGGRIDFSLKILEETETQATITFSVADDGIGMTAGQIAKLFVAFEQADANIATRFGGTGLGLTISQNLVKKMGGLITVQSRLGKGSVFSFTLGLKREQERPADESDASFPVPDLTGKRILLAEDVAINRMILQELLEETHVEIDEAEDGAIAVGRFAESSEGYYNLVFMDIQMPNLNGYEATKQIRALPRADAAAVPILAMTANAYREDIEQAMAAGMNGHLSKPIDLSAVMRALSEKLA